jgi:two-component system, cell cycle sensor histidine kinase and response regulator CckA
LLNVTKSEGLSDNVGEMQARSGLSRSMLERPTDSQASDGETNPEVDALSAGDGDCLEGLEGRLRELEEIKLRYDLAVRATTDGVWDWNILTNDEYFSPRWCEILGYDFDDPDLSHTYTAWASRIHPEDRPGVEAAIRAHLEEGAVYDVVYRHRHRTGEYRWQNSRGKAVLEDGRPVRMVGAIRDIHDIRLATEARVELEARLLAEQREAQLGLRLQQSQRAESLAVLAGGMAHEFNNLLVGIIGFADLAIMDIDDGVSVRPLMGQIRSAGKRAAELSGQLLAYAGRTKFSSSPVSLNHLIERDAKVLSVSCAARATLRFDAADDLPLVTADPTQLRQALSNIVLNAAESEECDHTEVSISTGVMHCDQDALDQACVVSNKATPGEFVFVEVVDAGSGIESGVMSRIFDPFFSTKFAGRGLGLAAVRGIVVGHGGAVTVKSEGGQGTSFRVFLPVCEVAAGPSGAVDAGAAKAMRQGVVLVVDDEDSILQLARRLLESAGFTVKTASNGVDGLREFRESASDIVCVVLDLVMPRMDGAAAYREMKTIKSSVPIVLSTGYADSEVVDRVGEDALRSLLKKPYDTAGLLAAVDKAVSARA